MKPPEKRVTPGSQRFALLLDHGMLDHGMPPMVWVTCDTDADVLIMKQIQNLHASQIWLNIV